MVAAFLDGFALGFSLILAIGAQNAFVLRQGLRGAHVFAVCLACALSDAVLITLGVAAFAAVEAALPGIAPAMRWGGAAFLLAYGALSFRRAAGPAEALEPARAGAASLAAALATCLALTWLNPHVYLDTVVLLGSVSTQYAEARPVFGLGAVTASFVFFFALGYGARLLRPLFARPAAWRVLEAVVGATMWAIAAKLVVFP
ncbi:LysE/ArgO family amino acid transporter [Psychromarinibacter sp. C21-152]|uniref:LysE/ArgO family amino acid transporter n=1 Tax=Psychromarinibacter sediminicola TaxID=3033385 RepID=A0AAE3T8U1_9RHOB|nr:LysE/ArgO family amino acid transporter [Psychromarinibacter sediminicola]MDF0599860.1 LysE/ArgO family amino acid transporter [Psychromarinibacter sediminicola]